MGWDLPALEKKKLLTIDYSSPVKLSTDRYLQLARDHVEKARVRRAVLDSLTSMSLGVPSERRFKELVYAMAKHMRAAGVTLVTTIEAEHLHHGGAVAGRGVSFIADNLIRLRYVARGSRLERGLAVVKARGIKHDTRMRRVDIARGGVRVRRTT
jgi:circadian clock protein KaiC